jgi:hypothetical protein
MHYYCLTTKNILGLKKKEKEMNFQIHKFLPFSVHPTMHLANNPCQHGSTCNFLYG